MVIIIILDLDLPSMLALLCLTTLHQITL